MTPTEIAKILCYTKPSKAAKPKGFSHRLEKWESIVLEFAEQLEPNIVKESFLTLCGFYEDIQ